MKSEKAKQELFKIIDRIEEIKNTPIELTDKEELELRTLEVKKMQLYSDWKD